ncbi:phage tail protein [Brevundimonas sp.]|uniref:phage tail protein n=1 Tax=Brevundimonas sp. TaxID=1871086 RepID=UPI002FC85A22
MSAPFVGEIRMFGFGRIPIGWLACDGSLQPIANNETLYTLLGTTYGGDGNSTFGLPDLRGQAPVHQGTGLGLTPRILGEGGGSESITLTTAQIPAHTHTFVADTAAAETSKPDPTQTLGSMATDTQYLTDVTGAVMYPLQANAIAPSGTSLPHDNIMPTLTVSFCIASEGIFPSQP